MIHRVRAHITSHKKLSLIVAALVLGGFLILFLIISDNYPIAAVNGSTISASRFWGDYRAAQAYTQNMLKTYMTSSTPQTSPSSDEIETVVLDELVEETLVHQGALKEAGKDLDYLVNNKLSKYDSDADLSKAALTVYGISYSDLRDKFLVPQAERDVLSGRLFLRGEKMEDWLKQSRASANVTVFSRKFRWDGLKIATST